MSRADAAKKKIEVVLFFFLNKLYIRMLKEKEEMKVEILNPNSFN